MRVLHIITGLAPGGAEQQLRLLLRHLPAECAVATLTNPGAVAAAIRDEGTPVVDLGMRHNRDVAVLPRLVRLIKAGHYDVVHTHLYRACVYGRLAARLAGVPHIVATEHSLGTRSIEGRRTSAGVRALYLATERLGDATIAVSSTVARRLVGWGVRPGRVVVLPNGVDAADFSYDPALRQATRARLGLSPDDRVVGAVGRLTPAKRFDVLVRALSAIDGASLLLVGDGPERAALEELASACGVASRVRFAGAAMDVRALLCAMDVFASPSAEETFGLAVLEALACGLPVRYVSCPALEELPRSAAPRARRLRLDAGRFRDELAAALRDDRRHQPPPAVSHYDIARLAERVAQLYELVRAGSPIATPRPETRPVASSGRFHMASLTEIRTRLLTQSVLLILAVVLGAGAGGWYAKSQPPTYTAQAFVVVVPQSDTDPIVAVKYAQAFGRIATQGAVLSEAAAAMRRNTSVDRVRRQVRASTSPDVPLIELTGSAKTPKEAADVANTVADALVKFGNDSRTRTKVRLASFVDATPPAGPSSPNPPLNVAVGAAAGLLIGGLAILAGVGAQSSVRRREEKEREEEETAGPPAPSASAEPEPFRGPMPDGRPTHEPQARAHEAHSYDARSYEAGSREARSHENRHGMGEVRADRQQR